MAEGYTALPNRCQRHFPWKCATKKIMVMTMTLLRIAIALTLSLPWMAKAEQAADETVKKDLSSVEQAIPDAIKALKTPVINRFPGGIQMKVTAANDQTRDHVIQGLNHLHGGWEFEASRHFAAAMTRDPNCLLAHWGMVMTLLNTTPETADARIAATDRLLHLLSKGHGSELERNYAYGLLKYFEEGADGAANAFRKVSKRFPDDLQSAIFAALFSRGGYDATGEATPDQVKSEKRLLEQMAAFPDSTIPLHSLLTIRAESPNAGDSLELARTLNQSQPGYPPSFHILGHYEWRAGNHREAATAFGRASNAYQKWMRENKVGVADCPEWIQAECYRIVALLSISDFETAYAAAQVLAAIPVPEDRPSSPGARFLLWDAKTLPARILLRRGMHQNAEKAAKALPDPATMVAFKKHSLAYWWVDGLRLALEAQRQSNAGHTKDARQIIEALGKHIETMEKTRKLAGLSGESLQWNRAFRALKVINADIRGLIASTGPPEMRDLAYNWFSSAMDHQRPEPLLYPPMILTPMAARLGTYHLRQGRPLDAIEAYQKALTLIPNDIHSLKGLEAALKAAGRKTQAAKVRIQIEALKTN